MKINFAVFLLATPLLQAAAPHPNSSPSELLREPFVKVNSTNQQYDPNNPWEKRTPFLRRGLGVLIDGGQVLVTAELVTNNNFVEIEVPRTNEKMAAEVAAIDYDANLALLKIPIGSSLPSFRQISLSKPLGVGARTELIQIESNGEIARTGGIVTTVGVIPYPMETIALLSYKVSLPLQNRDNSFVLPLVSEDKLVGLLARYDTRSQSGDVIPSPVIKRFLLGVGDKGGRAQGFPKVGVSFTSARDAQFREFLGLGERRGGVYVTEVLKGSPADRAGIRQGDLILKVAGFSVDEDGLYDDPDFGKILFTHLVTMSLGEALPFTIFREGKETLINVTPQPEKAAEMKVPPYFFDKAPRYVVLGGIIFQELTRSYLREWGNGWQRNAPQKLVYLDAFQNDLPPEVEKIVFISGVLPSPDTLGYKDLEFMVVKQVNGRAIRKLDDLAEAIESPLDGFHKIEFEEDPGFIILDAESVENNRETLMQVYGLPKMQNL